MEALMGAGAGVDSGVSPFCAGASSLFPVRFVCTPTLSPLLFFNPLVRHLQTTIIAVQYDGGVILGADSRTSTGAYAARAVKAD
jgi:hypothetical protein